MIESKLQVSAGHAMARYSMNVHHYFMISCVADVAYVSSLLQLTSQLINVESAAKYAKARVGLPYIKRSTINNMFVHIKI